MGNSLDVNVSEIKLSFDVSPEDTSLAVIVIMGPVVSFLHENSVAAILLFPAESVKDPAATLILYRPSTRGVNLAL